MDVPAYFHDAKDWAIAASGGSDTMLHVHVGLALYLGAQLVLRTRRGSIDALLFVLLVEALNECGDRLYWGDWRWPNTLGDIAATLAWPTAIMLVSRYRRRRWASVRVPRRDPGREGAAQRRSVVA